MKGAKQIKNILSAHIPDAWFSKNVLTSLLPYAEEPATMIILTLIAATRTTIRKYV